MIPFIRKSPIGLALAAALITCSLIAAPLNGLATSQKPTSVAEQAGTVSIAVIIDGTSKNQSAVNQLAAKQLEPILDLVGISALKIDYYLVQEQAVEPIAVRLEGWQTMEIPQPPSPDLPYDIFIKESDVFMAKLNAWKERRAKLIEQTDNAFRDFQAAATRAQMALEMRWAKQMAATRGRDFRRSAVAETVLAAARNVPNLIILATDLVDEPAGRQGRTTPFTPVELPKDIRLIVFESLKARQSPLLKGVRNEIITVPDFAAAAAAVIERAPSAGSATAAR